MTEINLNSPGVGHKNFPEKLNHFINQRTNKVEAS